jgi:hypothetical protein
MPGARSSSRPSNDNPVPFVLATFSGTTVTGFPLTAAGVATTPDVLVQGTRRSLVAVAISGAVSLGVIENGQFVARSTNQPINGGPPLALAPAPGGGAILLVSDSTATQLTRYDLDLSGATVTVAQGLTAALLTEPMRSMVSMGPGTRCWWGATRWGTSTSSTRGSMLARSSSTSSNSARVGSSRL